MNYTYLRIYADEAGESHLEDVEIVFAESDFVPPAPPVPWSGLSRRARSAGLGGRCGCRSPRRSTRP